MSVSTLFLRANRKIPVRNSPIDTAGMADDNQFLVLSWVTPTLNHLTNFEPATTNLLDR